MESHFSGKTQRIRELFDAFVRIIQRCGPVTIIPEKTRIAFQVRMSFAAVSIRHNYFVGHFVLARRLEHPRFLRVETYSPRNHVHAFRIASMADLDEEFSQWAEEAYRVGEQKHLLGGSARAATHGRADK